MQVSRLSDSPSLGEVQRVFWRAVRRQPLPDGYAGLFTVPQGHNLEERLVLYRDMYWNRQVGALLELLPDTCALVGLADFTPMLVTSLSALPSVHPAMEHLPARILPRLREHPGLSAHARRVLCFEVAMLNALVAPAPGNPVRALPSDAAQLARMRFAVCPGVSTAEAPDGSGIRLIGRPSEHASWWPIDARGAALVDAMQRGATLEQLCEVAALHQSDSPEATMAHVANLLMTLLREQLLCEEVVES